jgi:adenine phosphoribosyltransferase
MDTQKAKAILRERTRSIVDYPKPGIIFRDLTTVFQDGEAFGLALRLMEDSLVDESGALLAFDKFAGIEARGFLLAGALSGKLDGGVVLMRKPGKLPAEKISERYELEYGEDALEVHTDAILPGERIVIVDDLLATGGTAEAACRLVEKLGGEVVRVLFLVDLPDLDGRERLSNYAVSSIISFEGH